MNTSVSPDAVAPEYLRSTLDSILAGSGTCDEAERLVRGALQFAREVRPWAARHRCPGCGRFVPDALLVPHLLDCEGVKAVANCLQCDAEAEVLLLELPAASATEVPRYAPAPAGHLVDALPFEGALLGIAESVLETLVGHVTPKELCTPVALSFGKLSEPYELVTAQRAAAATKEGARSILLAMTYAREWGESASELECPWCHATVVEGKLGDHLVACAQHPQAVRGRVVARWVEARVGATPLPVAGVVATLQACRMALRRLLNVCAWFEDEFGWDGERAYVKSWAEKEFSEECARARGAITPTTVATSAADPVTQRYAAELTRARSAVETLLAASHTFVQRFRDSDVGRATIQEELEAEWKAARTRAAQALGAWS